jgi:hypothetical protein
MSSPGNWAIAEVTHLFLVHMKGAINGVGVRHPSKLETSSLRKNPIIRGVPQPAQGTYEHCLSFQKVVHIYSHIKEIHKP